jgi:hypothetical protein
MGPAAAGAVTALRDALIREADAPGIASIDIRGDAVVRALAAIGRPAVPTLRTLLSHRGDFVRARAHEAIDGMGAEAASLVPDLVRLLGTPWAYAALKNLTAIGPAAKSAVPALAEAIRTFEPPAERDVLGYRGFYSYVRTLAAIGPASREALPALRTFLDRAEPFEAVLARALIGRLTGTEVEEARHIVELIRQRPRETWGADELAFRMVGASVLPVLLEMLATGNELCAVALKSFEFMDPLDAEAAAAVAARMAPVVRDKRFRYDALGLVCGLGAAARELVPVLVMCLKERSHVPSTLAALAAIGPAASSATETIEAILQEEKYHYKALVALERIGRGANRAVAKVAALDDPGGQKITTLVAIGAGPDVLAPLVLEAIRRPVPGRYAAGCAAVADLGSQARDAVALLVVRDPDKFSIKALGAIGPPAAPAAEVIAAALWDASRYYSGDPEFAVLCCEALGNLGPAASERTPVVEALLRAGEHVDPEISAAARAALERICAGSSKQRG